MDPYNSYQSHTPIAPAADSATPSPARKRDHISRLDVSDKWKERFRVIERAGGPELPNFRDLTTSERRGIQLNWLAFFLGPFYYLAKGLWRQTIIYVIAAIVCVLTLEVIGLGKISGSVGYGFAAVYAMRANISYYKKIVLGEAPWV